MQTGPSNHTTPATPLKAEQPQITPQPWVKPTFELVPLNDALAVKTGSGTDQGTYSS